MAQAEKINYPIFHKVQKTRFLAVFWPKFAQKNFFSKIGLRHIRGFIVMHLCAKKSENLYEPISRKAGNRRTNGRTWVNL